MKMHQCITASVLSMACLVAQAEFVVVVGAKSPVSAVTAEQAAQIFLGKVSTLPGGETAVPVDQPDGVGIRNDFYEKLTNKTPKQVLALRANLVFSGKGKPPREVPASQEVKKTVSEVSGGIGYVEKSAVDSSVKVVYTQP